MRNKNQQLSGVNQADCSDMMIYINENKINKISLLYKPDATLFPIKETNPLKMRLKGWNWLQDKRPVTNEDIFVWK